MFFAFELESIRTEASQLFCFALNMPSSRIVPGVINLVIPLLINLFPFDGAASS